MLHIPEHHAYTLLPQALVPHLHLQYHHSFSMPPVTWDRSAQNLLCHELTQTTLASPPTSSLPPTIPLAFIFELFWSLFNKQKAVVVKWYHTRGLNTCAVIRCYSTLCQSRSEEVAGSIPAHGAYSFFVLPIISLYCRW